MKLRLLLLLLLLASGCYYSAASWLPKLGLAEKAMQQTSLAAQTIADHGYQILEYAQTLDHFSYKPESYVTFQQRYAVSFKYWGGAKTNSPIFVYTGDESALEGDLTAGFLVEAAAKFNALLIVIEHRYYGKSFPFKPMDGPYRNSSTLGYFSSSQALADYAELVVNLKKNLTAQNSPVIVMGGSYGGMLAAWFRLKYPHIVIGAVASSAPILYFDNLTPQDGYFSVVSRDYREASESCYQTIKRSWSEIDKTAELPNGLNILSLRFMTCRPLNNPQQLKDALVSKFSYYAQYNYPPANPVNEICKGIDGAPQGTDTIGRIIYGLSLTETSCFATEDPDQYAHVGWYWQECSEMVMPIGVGTNDTMFQVDPFDIRSFTNKCQENYGVTPRPHWITTEFGGHSIKSALERFASNIVFTNGLQDPYSSGGVLQNVSDSVVAISTPRGAHCMDIKSPSSTDPEWLLAQRNAEIEIIGHWLDEYNQSFTVNQ